MEHCSEEQLAPANINNVGFRPQGECIHTSGATHTRAVQVQERLVNRWTKDGGNREGFYRNLRGKKEN